MNKRKRFNPDESDRDKETGMGYAALARAALLQQAREATIGIALARPDRTATADDAMRWLIHNGKDPAQLGPAAGSLFRGEYWKWTGRWTKSTRVSNHSSDLRIWQYCGGPRPPQGPTGEQATFSFAKE
jgi:hypothetical protein